MKTYDEIFQDVMLSNLGTKGHALNKLVAQAYADQQCKAVLDEAIDEVKKEWDKYTYPRNQDVPFGDVIGILESLKQP